MKSHETIHLITYGLGNKFDKDLFVSIKNVGHQKPEGGLWASPVDSTYGWKEYCDGEFDDLEEKLSSHFEIVYSGRTIVIDSLKDLDDIIWKKTEYSGVVVYEPDYEAMLLDGIDAIYLTANGVGETRFSKPDLYGYSCECVLIMNPNCVKEV